MERLKELLITSPILSHPDFNGPYRCHIDASQFAVGGTLRIVQSGSEREISYFSKKLNDAQMNYSANDRELLGMVEFLKHFRCYLEGAEFEVITDNQVLKSFFDKKDLNRREARWLETLSEFGIFPITLKKGSVHVLGDALSRICHSEGEREVQNISCLTSDLVNQDSFKESLLRDSYFGRIIGRIQTGDNLKRYRYQDGVLRLMTGELCIPRKFVKTVLAMAHDSPASGHYATEKTLDRLSNFFWKKKTRDVYNYVKGCLSCQQSKMPNQKPITDPMVLEPPKRRWGHISMDFIQGLPTTERGFDTILTFVDRFSKRSHFIPCKSTIAATDVAQNSVLLELAGHTYSLKEYGSTAHQ